MPTPRQPKDQTPAKATPAGRSRYRRLPAAIHSVIRRIAAVAEPTRQVAFRTATRPATPRNHRHALAVVSANLWHDWPRQRSWGMRLETLAQLVEMEGADVVLVQEVTRTPHARADEWLADRLGMNCVYARANGHATSIGFEEGVAVLSRFPLGPPQLNQFRSRANPFVRRIALGTMVATPHGPLGAVSLHLSVWPRHNARQVAALPGWVSRLTGPHPAVVGGDFNAPEHRPSLGPARALWLDTFRQVFPHGDGTTHTLRWPWGRIWRHQRLDYIFLQPGERCWVVLDARHVETPDRPHSDHMAVVAHVAPQTRPVIHGSWRSYPGPGT